MDTFGRDSWRLIVFQRTNNQRIVDGENGVKRSRGGIRSALVIRKKLLQQLVNYSVSDDVNGEIENAIKLTNSLAKQKKKTSKTQTNAQVLQTQSTIEEERPPSPDINIKIKNINEKIDIQTKIIQDTKAELAVHCGAETESKLTIEKVVSNIKIEKDLPQIKLNANRKPKELNVCQATSRKNPFKLAATQSTNDLSVSKIPNIKKEIESTDAHSAIERMIEMKKMKDPSSSGSQFTNRKNETHNSLLSGSSLKNKRKRNRGKKAARDIKVEKTEPQRLMNVRESCTSRKRIRISDVYSDSDD